MFAVKILKLVILLSSLFLLPRTAYSTSCYPQSYTVSSITGQDVKECWNSDTTPKQPCQSLEYLLPLLNGRNCVNITISSSLALSGGLITLQNIGNWTIGGSEPVSIHCTNNSGIAFESSSHIHLDNMHFVNCSARNNYTVKYDPDLEECSAIYFIDSNDVSITGCGFLNGTGTGVIINDARGLNLIKDTIFFGNKLMQKPKSKESKNFTSGGLIVRSNLSIQSLQIEYTVDNCSFVENENYECHYNQDDMIGLGGGLTFNLSTDSSISIIDSLFVHNNACEGGGLHIYQNRAKVSISVTRSVFEHNRAIHEGGGIYLQQRNDSDMDVRFQLLGCTFTNNTGAFGGGLGVYNGNSLSGDVHIVANDSTWTNNSALSGGFAVGLSALEISAERPCNTTIFHLASVFDNCTFLSNTYPKSPAAVGAVHLRGSKADFIDAYFSSNRGTALYIRYFSYATFHGDSLFLSNEGNRGGALFVDHNSLIALKEGNLKLDSNHAMIDGGAIFVESTETDEVCVFESLKTLLNSSESITVVFYNNRAGSHQLGGIHQSIFIGRAGGCLRNLNVSKSGDVPMQDILLFDERIFSYFPYDRKQVVSFATKISLNACYNDTIEVMPGEYFTLRPTAMDIFGNNAYQIGNLVLVVEGLQQKSSHDIQLVGPHYISMDNFTKNNELFITANREFINHEGIFLEFFFNQPSSYHDDTIKIKIKLIDCKVGFSYNNYNNTCQCDPYMDDLICNSSSHEYPCVRYGYWYGDFNATEKPIPCPGQNCDYVNGHCPSNTHRCPDSPGFCPLMSNNSLCWKGRSGLLCSKCLDDHAFTFAGLRCVPQANCSRASTAYFILGLFAYWALLVVFVLIILNVKLSIGSGIAYGIMYYFSVVEIFTNDTITDVFLKYLISVSVALSQLCPRGLGEIEQCFIQSWNLNLHHELFHYVTPVAVIFLILVIVLFGRFCYLPKAISPAQNSLIHAMTILLLASYTSLTYTSFKILRPIWVNGELRVYVDPDIKYFSKEHFPYAAVALFVECFLSLPICFLALFATCLSKRVNIVKLRLKPFLDEFHACYVPECRWFAGFYFLARQVIFLVNIIPMPIHTLPEANNYLHSVNAIILIIHCSFQPYKLKWLNILDTLLLADVVFLSFFHLQYSTNITNRVIPYVLILFPSIYLLILIFVVTVKKVSYCLKDVKFCRRRFRSSSDENAGELRSACRISHTSVIINDSDEDNGFFTESAGVREPLLADSGDSGRSTYSQNSTYGDQESNKPFTSSSVRLSS